MLEMIVVLALIAILGSIFLSSGFGRTKVRNALITDSQDISSLVTEMQNKTTSFEETKNSLNNIGYGIYLDIANANKVESFYKFNSSTFDGSDLTFSSEKPTDDVILTNSNKINRICVNGCSTFSASSSIKLVSYFIKPKQSSYFAISQDGINYTNKVSSQDINSVCIEIISPSYNDYRHIDIKYIGQVSSLYGPCQ